MWFFKNIVVIFVFLITSILPIVKVSADTSIYNFSGVNTSNHGTNGNPIIIEHDSDVFPWTTSVEQNDSASPSDGEYSNAAGDDNTEYLTDDPGNNDFMAITFRFFIQENINNISNIQIKWNGNTDGATASNHSIWLRKDGFDEFGGTNTWVQLGSSLSINPDFDTNLIRNLTSNFSTYINGSSGQFEFVVTTDIESEDMRTNYVELLITYTNTPPPDTTAPSAISTLTASTPTQTSIDLNWTAVGDDGTTGTATSYDLRYSTATITEANWASATPVTGEPSPASAGTYESITISNLSPNTNYYFAIKVIDDSSNTSDLSNVASAKSNAVPNIIIPTTSNNAGGVAPTSVIFSGQAYPGSKIIVQMKNNLNPIYENVPLSIYQMSDEGKFYISYTALLSGQYFFNLRAKDIKGQETGTQSFNVDFTTKDRLVVEEILMPPTISFNYDLLRSSDPLEISGYSSPGSKIKLEIDDIINQEKEVNNSGAYSFIFKPGEFPLGLHYVKIKQIKEGAESSFSFPRTFKVTSLEYPRADFNKDGTVDVIDWSIFLFRWGGNDAKLKKEIDLDLDGITNIKDFSIFLKAIKI